MDVTVSELIAAYWRFAQGYYVKNGKPTDELPGLKIALRFLRRAFGAEKFRPALAEWRGRHSKDLDAWLWYSVLSTPAMSDAADELLEIAFGQFESIHLGHGKVEDDQVRLFVARDD